jgi:hypothetical protein
MNDMREIAYEVVLRACGFGSLAIFCVMMACRSNRALRFRPAVS